jgi:hypothetical protein
LISSPTQISTSVGVVQYIRVSPARCSFKKAATDQGRDLGGIKGRSLPAALDTKRPDRFTAGTHPCPQQEPIAALSLAPEAQLHRGDQIEPVNWLRRLKTPLREE